MFPDSSKHEGCVTTGKIGYWRSSVEIAREGLMEGANIVNNALKLMILITR